MVPHTLRLLFSFLLALSVVCSCSAQDSSLRKFLQNYSGSDADNFSPTRYFAAVVHLRGDSSRQIIVYLMGSAWCGTGGCTTLILLPEAPSYKVVSEISIVQLPIRVLDTKSNGWRDLGVWVQGGGVQPGYAETLSFDGTTYLGTPTVSSTQQRKASVNGKVVVPRSVTGALLYPKS